jgi:hypothetical protein
LHGCFYVWSNHSKHYVWLHKKRNLFVVGTMIIHVLHAILEKQLLTAFLHQRFRERFREQCKWIALFTWQCKWIALFTQNNEHCNSLAMFAWTVFVFFQCLFFVQFFYKKKTSLEWIKFTRTVISNQFYSW